MSTITDLLGKVTGKSHVGDDVIGGFFNNLLGDGSGGLKRLIDKLHGSGLGNVAASWVGKGENLPISADQVKGVLGSEKLQEFAAKMGLPPEKVSELLAQHMPEFVDKLTPEGKVPE